MASSTVLLEVHRVIFLVWRILLLPMCDSFLLWLPWETTHSLSVVKDTAWSRWAWTWGPVSCKLGLAVGSVLLRSRSPTKSLCWGRNSFLKTIGLQSTSECVPLRGLTLRGVHQPQPPENPIPGLCLLYSLWTTNVSCSGSQQEGPACCDRFIWFSQACWGKSALENWRPS